MSFDFSDITPLSLHVQRKRWLTPRIALFDLVDPDGRELPAFTAGAHVTVQTPSGAMRQYSLCGDPDDRHTYQLAIQAEANGRGGSLSMVEGVEEGHRLSVGTPKNEFELAEKARQFLLVAGGIGITPMRSMVHALQAEGLREFRLLYLTRDAASTPFLDEFQTDGLRSRVRVHHSAQQGRLDLWSVFEKPVAGTHVYVCGPQGLIDEVCDMTGHWASGTVHVERFGADTQPHAEDRAFEVCLQSTGQRVSVAATQSILEALRQEGIRVPSSCESGTCGSCKVGYREGEVDHRDLVLMPEERGQCLMVCVSRARSDALVLDL